MVSGLDAAALAAIAHQATLFTNTAVGIPDVDTRR